MDQDLPLLPQEGLLLEGALHVAYYLWWAAQSWVLSEEHVPKGPWDLSLSSQ